MKRFSEKCFSYKRACRRLNLVLVSALVLAIVSSFAGSVSAQALQIESELDRAETEFHDLLRLTYRVSYNPSQATPLDSRAPRPELKRLEFYSFSSKQSSADDGSIVITYTYQLKPIASGAGRVEPVAFNYYRLPDSSLASVTTEPLKAQIALPKPQTESDGSMLWLWFLLAGILLTAAVVFLLVRRNSVESEDPYTIAVHTRLMLLKSLTSKGRAQYYQTLYDALYDLSKDAEITTARRGESDRVISEIENAALPGDIREPLVRWLSESAKEKFAPESSQPGETLRQYHEVEDFLRERWLPFRRNLDATRRAEAKRTRTSTNTKTVTK